MKKLSIALAAAAIGAAPAMPANAGVYLNDDAGISVSGVLSGGTLANIIDADSPSDLEVHSGSTHAFRTGAPLDLRFDLGAVYDLATFHLWNYEVASNWAAQSYNLTFRNAADAVIGTTGEVPIAFVASAQAMAQDFNISANGVRYVEVFLTPGTSGTDIMNIGFTTAMDQVPEPAVVATLAVGIAGMAAFRRRKSAD